MLKLPRLWFLWLIIGLLFLGGCFSFGQRSGEDSVLKNQQEEDSFISIFDGKTLEGWKGDDRFWHVKDGAIVGEETEETLSFLEANTFLIWQGGEPEDFELKGTFRISKNGNSGVQYRSEMVNGVPYGMKGYQMDIDGMKMYTGMNYEERKRTIIAFRGQKVTLPNVDGPISSFAKQNTWTASILEANLGDKDSLGEFISDGWNDFHIIVKGNHLQHFINGILMCDVTDEDEVNRKSKGLLGLQLHKLPSPMKVEFKNLKIKED